jgi:gamma-glutamyltranspeptidase/glutathione hydrolase
MNLRKPLLFLGLVSLLPACTALPPEAAVKPRPAIQQSELGEHGMVVTAHPEATLIANRILELGGNAVDASVAAGFAITVVEPTMNSIGGRSQILLKVPELGYVAINGMTEIPDSYVRPEEPVADGYGVIATPGVVAALSRIHSEYGSLPWNDLVQPAIRLASDGFIMLPGEASRQESGFEAVKDNSGFQQNILVDSRTAQAGELFIQPGLARTLSKIATDGAKAFYEGELAETMAKDIQANGGYVSYQDLKNYRAKDGRYITVKYRDFEIHTIAAPAGGGLVVKALNILENFPLQEMNDLEWAALVNQALALAIQTLNDDYEESNLKLVTSKEWARFAASEVSVPDIPIDHVSGNVSSAARLAAVDWAGDSWGPASTHTTHFVTADCQGMVVSITQTIGPLFGSKVITPELGFPYASTMGTYLSAQAQTPGARPRTTIAPTIVTKDGDVIMVLGAAGGLRILSGIVQTISRYIDQGMSLEEAVAAPRIHPALTSDPLSGERRAELRNFHVEMTLENGWSQSDVESGQNSGFDVIPNSRSAAFARVHALGKPETKWVGVADPDWEGSAATPDIQRCALK